jgi:carbamoyltransferase
MEYGPRALGHRSILASPVDPSINKWLNDRLRRTEFMPFAPSCLYEYSDEVFDIPKEALKRPAEFMTITFRMKTEWVRKAPAVSHVDQTARPQLVCKEVDPLYHRLLSEYLRLTGLPLVINTSFTVHEEPIVCQPDEGIKALRAGMIDVLAIGPFLARKRDVH